MKHQCTLRPVYICMLLALTSQPVSANPFDPAVVNGQASFATAGNTLTVTNTPGTIINWQGFSIGSNEITRFAQQSASSAVLNRVISGNPSSILGSLLSNGRVFLVNPNGIVFGAGSTIDVAGLVATTLDISKADFLEGRNNFNHVPGAQNISNAGNITAQSGGQIFLIAPNVENTGVITAPNGEILLAAGHSVELVNSNDPGLRVNITAPAGDVTNVKQLVASAGKLGLFGTVVRNSGMVSADSAVMQGGKIVFKASQRVEAGGSITANGARGGSVTLSAAHSSDPNAPGVVIHTGSIQAQGAAGTGGTIGMDADSILSTATIHADGASAGGVISVQAADRALSTASAQYSANSAQGQGGDILVSAHTSNYSSGAYSATGMTGGNITLAGNEIKLAGARLDASGTNGGGTIHVGGVMHGAAGFAAQGVTLANATNVIANSATRFNADALQFGDGGQVVLWSDQAMRFKGNISATGGASSGNGGVAEVSGLASLGYGGLVNLSATHGSNGTLLLDPRNITIVPGSSALVGGVPYQEIFDPTPGAGEGFGGWQNLVLGNGNILIASPLDSAFGVNSGAVYLFNPTGLLVSALVGSASGDKVGAVTNSGVDYSGLMQLANGNVLVKSNNWNGTFGAVTWMNQSGQLADGSTGGAVSATNSLVGGTAGDKVGSSVNQLANSNVLVMTSTWNNAGNVNAGAVTWMDGATGALSDGSLGGAVSAANSLVGNAAGDQVGSDGITLVTDYLTYWNYAVRSSLWGSGGVAANALGAVTWVNGATGKLSTAASGGVLSSANSLVGSAAGDKVGTMTTGYVYYGTPYMSDTNGISTGSGNLVVVSNNWNNGGTAAAAGAVTWMNGATGALADASLGGLVSNVNSLVGTAAGDKIGTVSSNQWYGPDYSSGLVWLNNGNYLVRSTLWGSGGIAANALGAVTWGGIAQGVTGNVSSANSIVGSVLGDRVGVGITDAWTADPGLVILPNGNYVVVSSQWGGGKGAVTWGNGNSGTSGAVAGIAGTGNALSLVGVGPGYDGVGAKGIAVQQNGGSNYVVKSPWFDSGGLPDSGAITWMNGTTGSLSDGLFGGAVSSANSLLGGFAYDNVGEVTALNNGNFLAITPVWGSGVPSGAGGIGAVSWMSGATGKLADLSNGGVVSSANSVVGSTGADMSGLSVMQLANGNLLLKNPLWDNGTNQDVGALTWMNGLTGELANSIVNAPVYGGVIGITNSLVGAYGGAPAVREQIGDAGVTELSSGNVVVQTYTWHNPNTNADRAGAVTWMDGATGRLVDGSAGGTISALNSLVGDVAGSMVGNGALTQLGNGNVVITSSQWSTPTNNNVGAVTWMDGATGALSDGTLAGVVSTINSLVGTAAGDQVGSGGINQVTDYSTFWNYVVLSPDWANGTATRAGAITWMDGATGMTSDGLGVISTANSLVGSSIDDRIGYNYWYANAALALNNGNIVFANSLWNGDMGAVTWMEGATGLLADGTSGGVVSAANSLVGSTVNDNVGINGITEITDNSNFWNYLVISPGWANGTAASAGAVTLGDGSLGTVGVISASNSLVGGAANDRVGSGGIRVLTNYSSYANYLVLSPDWGGAGGAGKGAVTWVNGRTGQLTTGAAGGVVSSVNSLTGSSPGDQVGVAPATYYNRLGGVNVLGNGNLLIRSQHWGGEFSALTWMNGATGALAGGATGGTVSASNSLLGGSIYDDLGNGMVGLTELVNGNWVITSADWGNGGISWNRKGAATWMNGTTGQIADGSFGGVVSATNSLVGTSTTLGLLDYFCDGGTTGVCGGVAALSDGNYVVYRQDFYPNVGTVSLGNGISGTVGTADSNNSLFVYVDSVQEMASQPGKILIGSGATNGGQGGLYLFGQPTGQGSLFADSPGADSTIGAGWIAGTLDSGTNVVLQANNDITQWIGAAINATGLGNLTLRAGRSVMLNDVINIAGVLDITANDPGAIAANRAAGAAILGGSLAKIMASALNFANTGGDILAGAIWANTGLINLSASNNITVNGGAIWLDAGSSIATSGGNIALTGVGTASNLNGIYLSGATLDAGGGNIVLHGTGFTGATLANGVYVTNASAVKTIGTGTITLNGTGGAGTDDNYGVRLGLNAAISSVDGAISMTGLGAGSGVANFGVYIHDGATVDATGSGTITLNGTGSATGTTANSGIRISSSVGATRITSASGAIFMDGVGGTDGDGLQIVNGARVQSGTGAITLGGTTGDGGSTNDGVYVTGVGTLVTSGGNIDITGASITTVGTANRGVAITSSAHVVATGAGAITMSGTGGYDGDGLQIVSGALVQSGTGLITLNGISGNGSGPNKDWGVWVGGTGTAVTSGGGMAITGTSTSTDSTVSNHGLIVNTGAKVTTTAGLMTMTGTKGAGATSNAVLLSGTPTGGVVNAAAGLAVYGLTGDVVADIGALLSVTGNANISAYNNILFSANSSLVSSLGPVNISLNPGNDGGIRGGIYLDTGSSINSNGGSIRMGSASTRAIGNGTVTGGKTFDSGIYVLGDITAGAGDVMMYGEGANNNFADGITFAGGTLSSNGVVTIDGIAHGYSTGTVLPNEFAAGVNFLGAGTRLTTQTGTVTVNGLNTAPNADPYYYRADGIMVETGTILETTGSGTLTFNGTANSFNTSWGIGVVGGTIQTTAAGGGAITLNGTNGSMYADGGIVILGGNVLSNGGDIRMVGSGLGGSVGIVGGSTIGGGSSGNILIKANNSGAVDLVSGSSINAGNNVLTLSLAGGSVSDNSNSITAGALRLLGTGTFNLGGARNNVSTLAANAIGNVTYTDTNGFAIGSVTSFDGLATNITSGVNTNGYNFSAVAGNGATGNITSTSGGITAGTVNLINLNGSISLGDVNATASGLTTQNAINVQATGWINTASMDAVSGNIRVAGDTGVDLDVNDWTPTVRAQAGEVNISSAAGDVTSSYYADIIGQNVTISSAGAVNDGNVSNHGTITASALHVTAGAGIELYTVVGALTTNNTGTGNTLVNNTGPLLVNGMSDTLGGITLNNAGSMTLGGGVYANGIALTASGAASDIVVNSYASSSNVMAINAGRDLILSNGTIWSNGALYGSVGRDVSITGAGRLSGLFGSPDIGNASNPFIVGGMIRMNDDTSGMYGGQIHSGMPYSIWIHFPNLASGGYFVNGVEGVVTSGASGFYADGQPAVLDGNLHITYGQTLTVPPTVVMPPDLFVLSNLPTPNRVVDMPSVAMNTVNLMFALNPSAAGGTGGEEDNPDDLNNVCR